MTKAEAREKCKTDPFYLSEILGYDFQHTRDVHQELFDKLPMPKEGVPVRDWSEAKNALILWSRGHFKTSATVVRIVQIILNAPDVRILLMNANLKLTKKWLAEVKSHFNGKNPKSRLLELFPQFAPDPERPNNQLEFTVLARERKHLKEATVTAASPRAVETGQHYDVFFADDLVNANNFRNIELLDKLESEFNNFIPLLDPGSYTVVTGTRYHHADIYGRIIRRNQGEWNVSVKTCWADDAKTIPLFQQRETADGRKIGFTKAILDQIFKDDPEMASAQYLNKIIVTKQQLFPESMILGAVRSSKEKDFPQTPSILTVDLAEGKKADSDHAVVAAGRMGVSGIWVTDLVGNTFSPYQLAIVVIQMALKHRPSVILIEDKLGAGFFVEYVRTIAREKNIYLPIVLKKYGNQKDAKYLRIAACEKWLRRKQLFFAAGIPDFERMLEEYTQFPKGRHDDRPDAISMIVDHFSAGYIPPPQNPLPPMVQQIIAQMQHTEKPEETPNPMGSGFSC